MENIPSMKPVARLGDAPTQFLGDRSHPKSASGQTFTFRPSNERRLSGAEADQALTSQACQELTFRLDALWNVLALVNEAN
jgi:hypothetical protein